MTGSAREALRLLGGGEDADHRAHRVADEDDLVQVELGTYFEDVLRVARERRVALWIVGREVRVARSDVVEEDDAGRVDELAAFQVDDGHLGVRPQRVDCRFELVGNGKIELADDFDHPAAGTQVAFADRKGGHRGNC